MKRTFNIFSLAVILALMVNLVGMPTTSARAADAGSMVVTGRNITISNGDTTPSASDDTDFGSANVNWTTSLCHYYTIKNNGATDLNVTVDGPTSGDFQWPVVQSGGLVPASGSILMRVCFTPSTTGTITDTISLISDDPSNPTFTFAVKGVGTNSYAPSEYDTSSYMDGTVATRIVFVDGPTLQWANATGGLTKAAVEGYVDTGLNSLKGWAPAGANLNFTRAASTTQTATVEPDGNPDAVWINDIMTTLGATGLSSRDKAIQYANDLRKAQGTNWGYIVFAVLVPNGSSFVPYASEGGPFIVIPYAIDGSSGTSAIGVAHETSHVFGAADQYNGSDCTYTGKYGYMGGQNINCYDNPGGQPYGSSTLMMGAGGPPDISTQEQIGWKDTNGNGIPDPIDTTPTLSGLTAYAPDPTTNTVLVYSGGVADDQSAVAHYAACGAFPADFCYRRDVNINTIATVEYRVDGGAWTATTPGDGFFNSDYEGFSFTTPTLAGGSHTIEVRAKNSAGNYSTIWSDNVTINGAPVTHTVTFSSAGATPASYPTQYVADGDLATNPGSPTLTGYTFLGWYAAGIGFWNFSNPVTSDLSMGAQWNVNYYNVSFDPQGGSPTPPSRNYRYDSLYGGDMMMPTPLPTVSWAGHTFNGWYDAPSGGNLIIDSTPVTIAANHTLYAQWTATCPSTVTVANANDSGAGSLRQAITDVCDGGLITIDSNLAGQTLALTSGEMAIAKSVTIDGSAAPDFTISGNNASRAFNISSGTVTLNSLTISNGAGQGGGGILNQGALTVTNSSFLNNNGNVGGNAGGAIWTNNTLNVSNSTFSGNQARTGGALAINSGTTTVTNSTFTGNSAVAAGYPGGAIVNNSSGVLWLRNNTFSANTSASGTGTSLWHWGGNPTTHLINNIMANGALNNECAISAGSIGTNAKNLMEGGGNNCGVPAFTSDPMLNALAPNGGLTQTMSLQAGSPALNAGDAATCAAAPVNNLDQRGQARPQGDPVCDIGAYESSLVSSHTVTFDGNGNDGGSMSPQTASSPTALTSNGFTRTGFTFTGWDTNPLGGGTTYGDGATYSFASDVTLYAQWTALSADLAITKTDGMTTVTAGGSVTYTITASNSGPDAATGATVADTFPASLSAINWTCVGAGGGTCTAAGSGNISDTVNLPAGGSVTYTASANISAAASGTLSNTATVSSGVTDPSPANNSATDADSISPASHTVTFHANGGSGTMTPQSNNVSAALKLNTFTLQYYTFAGWDTSAAGTTVVYADGANYSFAADVDLYAVWTAIPAPAAFTKTAPTNAATGVPTSLNLTWGNSSGQTDYEYCYDSVIDGACQGNSWSTTVNNTTLFLGGLTNSTQYEWQIRAIGPGGITYANGGTWWTFTTVAQDITPPTVLSIVRAGTSPASSATVDFTVTFSEAVTGVGENDFTLTTSGVSVASVSTVNGSGDTYTVTVNTGTGNGTIRLDLVDDDSIQDAASLPLAGSGSGNGDFTTGELYSIIKSVTFEDVPDDYWANSYIERLVVYGITGGCSTTPLNYCPEASVTRAQMAVFLEIGIHGLSFVPPDVTPTFGDTAGNFAEDWIEALKADGVTAGCGNGNYCPNAPVTRAQMAVFLLRSKYGSAYTPPAISGSPVFTDVPSDHWAAAWIEQLANEGVTGGCGGGAFCPNAPVTRAQMAVFLVTTFNLP